VAAKWYGWLTNFRFSGVCQDLGDLIRVIDFSGRAWDRFVLRAKQAAMETSAITAKRLSSLTLSRYRTTA